MFSVLFSRRDRASCERTAARLDRAFAQVGIERHPGKDVTGELNATAIGIDIVNGLMIWACAPKLRLLLAALHFAISIDVMTPLQMAALLGHVQWFNLLNRDFPKIDPSVGKIMENHGHNNYGIFCQFYGEIIFK